MLMDKLLKSVFSNVLSNYENNGWRSAKNPIVYFVGWENARS